MSQNKIASGFALLLLAVAGYGCTKGTSDNIGEVSPQLQHAADCNELLGALKDDAHTKLGVEVAGLQQWYVDGEGYGYGGGVAVQGPGAAPQEDSAGGDKDSEGSDPTAHSDTNTQVAGVDEADIVKVSDDGKRLFIVSNDKLYVVDSWPAAETALAATLDLHGYGQELFLAGDKVVVFSSAFDVPEELQRKDEGGGDIACPQVEARAGGSDVAYNCGYYSSFTKISVIDVSAEPKVLRELYYEGSYTSSRRHGDRIRAILQTNLNVPPTFPNFYEFDAQASEKNGYQPLSRSERQSVVAKYAVAVSAAIDGTKLEDWLPTIGQNVDGEIAAIAPDCSNFYIPQAGLTDYGITSVVGLSLTDDAISTTSIMGWTQAVYANEDTLVLAQPDWSWSYREDATDQTLIHRFALDGESAASTYEGSGFVPGSVKDQFAFDVKDNVIRVATTVSKFDYSNGGGGVAVASPPPPETMTAGAGTEENVPASAQAASDAPAPLPSTSNFPDGTSMAVFTLEPQNGALAVVGSTGPLAAGERIFSTRYIGDIGYVVTFRQVDPLFAIDLSDAHAPKVLGELTIPGFSEYMHPLDADHLLTIGREADANGTTMGLALQIFDVSNPAAPTRTQKHVFAGEGYSDASYDHKAFTYYADKKLLAFPFVHYYPDFGSTLELFSVDADEGFTRLGSVAHTDFVTNACGEDVPKADEPGADVAWSCNYAPDVRRGVFISDDDHDYIYSLSWTGLMVHDVDDLATSLASVPLAQ